MLISRELDYALRILRGLGDGDMHTMRALCEDELIPQKFAYKIIRKLAAADFITAVRGVGGGVRLTADLSALTVPPAATAASGWRQRRSHVRPAPT